MIDIISLLNKIIIEAIFENASDIHLEPLEALKKNYRIRKRVDSILSIVDTFTYNIGTQLIIRIKILSYLDISQKNSPQDGHFIFKENDLNCDIRVSIFPTINGEKVVLRFLKKENNFSFLKIGFPEEFIPKIKNLIKSKDGCLLVTGPTGSGKTTTLYALLDFLNCPEKNIVTLEDPVEYNISGIFQTQIDKKINLTFVEGIRNLLRQDPDIMLIGEIRDKETALIAIEAALTGHLILSSLHTTNALSSLLRLKYLSIEPVFLAATLKGIIAQRLMRQICSDCSLQKIPTEADLKTMQRLFNKTLSYLFVANGCKKCVDGFKGRRPIFELLIIDHKMQEKIINNNLNLDTNQDCLIPFKEHAFLLLKNGDICLQDLALEF